MVAFNSDTGGTPPRTPRYGGVIARKASFIVPTGFLQASDSIALFTIPSGALLLDLWASNTGTGQTLDVGDAADDDRYLAAVAADGAIDRAAAAALNFAFTADTPLVGVFNTANPTATGVVVVAAQYILTP